MRVWTADQGRILCDGEVVAVLSYETPYRTLDWTMKEWAAFIVSACNAAEQRLQTDLEPSNAGQHVVNDLKAHYAAGA